MAVNHRRRTELYSSEKVDTFIIKVTKPLLWVPVGLAAVIFVKHFITSVNTDSVVTELRCLRWGATTIILYRIVRPLFRPIPLVQPAQPGSTPPGAATPDRSSPHPAESASRQRS